MPLRPAFFQWLGAVPYLTREAVSSTLKFISEVPEAVVVIDYAEPFQNCASIRAVAESAAARGEPRLSLFDPA
jgi:O-methyltransferase involved in polyketide biosynthesis